MNEPTQETISKVTGISKPEQDKIFLEVKANRAKLDGCQRPHDFSICLDRHTKEPIQEPTPEQRFGAHWRCTKCGGRVDGLARIWYALGLLDGGAGKL